MIPLRVLIVEDSESDAELILLHLKRAGYAVTHLRVETAAAMQAALADQAWDIIISDYNLPSFSAPEALALLQASALELPFIVASGTITEEVALDLMRAGAADYLMKDRLARLGWLVKRELNIAQVRSERKTAQAALEAWETRFYKLFELSPYGVVLIDPKTTRVVDFNTAAHRQLGYTRAQFAELCITDIEANETPAETAAHAARAQQNIWEEFETRHRTREGEIREVRVHLQTLELGGKALFYCIFQDITAQKQLDAALRTTEMRWRVLVNESPAGVIQFDREGVVLMTNRVPAGCKMEEVLGAVIFRWLPPSEQDLLRAVMAQVVQTRTSQVYESRLEQTNGEVRWYKNHVAPVLDAGEVITFILNSIDITEHKQLSEAILRSREEYRLLVENQTDLIVKTDLQGHYLYVSPSYCDLFGKTEAELLGNVFTPLVHEADQPLVAQAVAKMFQPPYTCSYEERALTRFGWRWIEWSGRAVFDAQGQIVALLGTGRDVQQRKQAENDLRAAKLQLEALWNVTELEDADLNKVAAHMLETTLRITGSPDGFCGFINDAETTLSIYAWAGESVAKNSPHETPKRIPVREAGIWAEAVRRREPLLLNRGAAELPNPTNLPEWHMELTNLLVVPQFSRGKIVALVVAANRVGDYAAQDIQKVSSFLASVQTVMDKKRAETELRESERFMQSILNALSTHVAILAENGQILAVNDAWRNFARQNSGTAECLSEGANYLSVCAQASTSGSEDAEQFAEGLRAVLDGTLDEFSQVYACHSLNEKRWFVERVRRFTGADGTRLIVTHDNITEQKLAEEALEKRLVALTRPLDDAAAIGLEELFNLKDLQRLQDEFANATGVASIITLPNGVPITRPSNFCRLCSGVIRATVKGQLNCFQSDAALGRWPSTGPTIQPCLSGGLWDAGAGISVGDRHVANWLIGQVRDETQTEAAIRAYAQEIGADEQETVAAFREVPAMSRAQFENVAQVLFTLANQLSTMAYQNVQQARFISEQKRVEELLRQSEERYQLIDEASQDMIFSYDLRGKMTHANSSLCRWLDLPLEQVLGKNHVQLGFSRELCDQWDELHRQAFARDASVSAEMLAVVHTEPAQYIEVTLNPIHSAIGKIIGIAGTARNIQARKQAEAQIIEQLAELRRWNAITLGREDRILELKSEINRLLTAHGKPARYASAEDTPHE